MSPDARRSRHDIHSEPKTRESTGGSAHTPRRRFLAAVGAMVAGGLAGVRPIVANAAALLNPLRRRERDAELVRVAILDSLSESRARRFTVSSDRVDAWTTHRATPVGAVYLTRSGDEVSALNAVCPHAGCLVNPGRTDRAPSVGAIGACPIWTVSASVVRLRETWTS